MSFQQTIEQYKSKYSCKIQNILLLSIYIDLKIIKRLRSEYTFSELFNTNFTPYDNKK